MGKTETELIELEKYVVTIYMHDQQNELDLSSMNTIF